MNKKIAVIQDKSTPVFHEQDFFIIDYLQEQTDEKIEELIKTKIFANTSRIEKLIIPARLGKEDSDYIGLKIALHIRLTKELYENRFIPIIIVSSQNESEILANQFKNNKEKTAALLFTPGIKLVSAFNLKEAIVNFNKKISEQILKSEVYPKLLITNQREEGHQLANEWGVFRLAKFAGIELKSAKLPSDLFFKYHFSKNNQNIDVENIKKIGLSDKPINVLLVDDYAKKGWAEVLKHIVQSNFSFHKTVFHILDTYDEAIKYKDYEKMDIVFLDLRLKPEEDKVDSNSASETFSGMEVLNKIKSINEGIQVIVLTASNKAWNMKNMLDRGADGYFIKESPEIAITEIASKKNYDSLINLIKLSIKKKYLKDIYKDIKELKSHIDTISEPESFKNELKNQLDLSFLMLKNASMNEINPIQCPANKKTKEEKQFAYAYVSLYMTIEIITSFFVSKTDNGQWVIKDSELVNNIDKTNYTQLDSQFTGENMSVFIKFAAIYFQKWSRSYSFFIKKVDFSIRKRNYFVHNDERNIDFQKDGSYVNHDIFEPKGFIELFNLIKQIIKLL